MNLKMLKNLIVLVVGLAVVLPTSAFAIEDSCRGIKHDIKRVKSRIEYKRRNQITFHRHKLIRRLQNLKAAKISQGCVANNGLPAVDPINDDGLACVQMLVCRIVDGEVKVWPDPCVAAEERPDFESLPFC